METWIIVLYLHHGSDGIIKLLWWCLTRIEQIALRTALIDGTGKERWPDLRKQAKRAITSASRNSDDAKYLIWLAKQELNDLSAMLTALRPPKQITTLTELIERDGEPYEDTNYITNEQIEAILAIIHGEKPIIPKSADNHDPDNLADREQEAGVLDIVLRKIRRIGKIGN